MRYTVVFCSDVLCHKTYVLRFFETLFSIKSMYFWLWNLYPYTCFSWLIEFLWVFYLQASLFVLVGIVNSLPYPGYLGLSAPAATYQLQPAAVQIQTAVPVQAAAALPLAYAAAPLTASYSYQNQVSQRLQPAALAIPSYQVAAAHIGWL